MEEDWWKTSCVKTCCTFHVLGSRVQSTAVSIWIVIWNGERDLVGFCYHDNCWVSFYGYQFTYVYTVSPFDPTHLHELINTGPQRQKVNKATKFTPITTTVTVILNVVYTFLVLFRICSLVFGEEARTHFPNITSIVGAKPFVYISWIKCAGISLS